MVLQQKAEREARLAEKKAKKEEERRKKFAKKVSLFARGGLELPALVLVLQDGSCWLGSQ